MVDTKILLFCLAWLKDAAGQQKNRLRLRSRSKSGGSDSTTLLQTDCSRYWFKRLFRLRHQLSNNFGSTGSGFATLVESLNGEFICLQSYCTSFASNLSSITLHFTLFSRQLSQVLDHCWNSETRPALSVSSSRDSKERAKLRIQMLLRSLRWWSRNYFWINIKNRYFQPTKK